MAEGKSASAQIRERLLAGEALNAADVAKEYNVSANLLHAAAAALRKEGHRTEPAVGDDGRSYTQIKIPKTTASRRTPPKTSRQSSRRTTAQRSSGRQPAPKTSASDDLRIGQTLMVMMLEADHTGEVRFIGLQNGDETSRVRVELVDV